MQSFEREVREAVTIQKDREHERDQLISQQHKQERMRFFTHQIRSKLKRDGVDQQQHQSIINLFIRQKQRLHQNIVVQLAKEKKLQPFEKQIKQLQQILNTMEQQYRLKQRQCVPIQQILQLKQTNLKIIRIQYQESIDSYENVVSPYSVSAFDFFKVIFSNKLLTEATLKGVDLWQFHSFMQILNPKNKGQEIEKKREQFGWIKSLCPLKSLKLAICALVQIHFQSKEKPSAKIDDLKFFQEIFCQVSNIAVKILLLDKNYLAQRGKNLYILWDCLKRMKSIQIQLLSNRYYYISTNQVPIFRSLLFGGLAFLTEITKISFHRINFHSQVPLSEFLAIEQSLSTLFENNRITHLELNFSNNFPLLPKIKTLQSIEIKSGSFRKDFSFMSRAIQTNNSLKSIISYDNSQQWRIDEGLFDQLQILIASNCKQLTIPYQMLGSPSSIKHLRLRNTATATVINRSLLPTLMSKLYSITVLLLESLNFGHQHLCTVPSPHLQEIHIIYNNTITDEGIEYIDLRWPSLRHLTVYLCKKLTENVWSHCSFKGLFELRVDKEMLSKSRCLQELKKRGIKVFY